MQNWKLYLRKIGPSRFHGNLVVTASPGRFPLVHSDRLENPRHWIQPVEPVPAVADLVVGLNEAGEQDHQHDENAGHGRRRCDLKNISSAQVSKMSFVLHCTVCTCGKAKATVRKN